MHIPCPCHIQRLEKWYDPLYLIHIKQTWNNYLWHPLHHWDLCCDTCHYQTASIDAHHCNWRHVGPIDIQIHHRSVYKNRANTHHSSLQESRSIRSIPHLDRIIPPRHPGDGRKEEWFDQWDHIPQNCCGTNHFPSS